MSDDGNDVLVQVTLPRKVWDAVERAAAVQGCNRTEALRRAISTDAFRLQLEAEGARWFGERAGGEIERIEWPYESTAASQDTPPPRRGLTPGHWFGPR